MNKLTNYIIEKLKINKNSQLKNSLIDDFQSLIVNYLLDKYNINESIYSINIDNKTIEIVFNDCIKKGTKLFICVPTSDNEFGKVFQSLKNFISEADNHKYEDLLWGGYCDYASQKFIFSIK